MHVIETEIRNYLMLYDRATGIICLGISEELLLEYMLVDVSIVSLVKPVSVSAGGEGFTSSWAKIHQTSSLCTNNL